MLENRDYTLIIDKSGSMSTNDQAGGKSRWEDNARIYSCFG